MQVKLAVEILEMRVPIDKARQYGLAGDIDHLGARRHSDLAIAPDRRKPAVADDDDRIIEWRPPGAIDQPAAPHHQHFVRHFSPNLLPPARSCPGFGLSNDCSMSKQPERAARDLNASDRAGKPSAALGASAGEGFWLHPILS